VASLMLQPEYNCRVVKGIANVGMAVARVIKIMGIMIGREDKDERQGEGEVEVSSSFL
jgi:hypothetical protein